MLLIKSHISSAEATTLPTQARPEYIILLFIDQIKTIETVNATKVLKTMGAQKSQFLSCRVRKTLQPGTNKGERKLMGFRVWIARATKGSSIGN